MGMSVFEPKEELHNVYDLNIRKITTKQKWELLKIILLQISYIYFSLNEMTMLYENMKM